jgi:hypothetical protein
MTELDEIRKRTRTTREVIDGASRRNYVVESPALLDREALLRAVDAAVAAGGENVREAVYTALQK